MHKKPAKRRHENTKREIIELAIKIIIKEGGDKLSLRYLADKIDYSHAALYKYFKNKIDLMEEVRKEGLIRLADYITKDLKPEIKINEFLFITGMRFIEFAEKYPELYLAIFNNKLKSIPIDESIKIPGFSDIFERVKESNISGEMKLPKNYTPLSFAYQNLLMLHGIVMLNLSIMRDPSVGFSEMGKNIMKSFYDFFCSNRY